jgi:hypothetical protein
MDMGSLSEPELSEEERRVRVFAFASVTLALVFALAVLFAVLLTLVPLRSSSHRMSMRPSDGFAFRHHASPKEGVGGACRRKPTAAWCFGRRGDVSDVSSLERLEPR